MAFDEPRSWIVAGSLATCALGFCLLFLAEPFWLKVAGGAGALLGFAGLFLSIGMVIPILVYRLWCIIRRKDE